MKTVTMKSVCDRAAQRAGLDPTQLANGSMLALGAYVDEAVRKGWEWNDWPEWCEVELRALRPDFDASRANAINDEVFYGTAYYRCRDANTGEAPENALFWDVVTPDPYVLLATRGQTEMGAVFAISKEDTRVQPRAIQYHFTEDGDRVWLSDPVATRVWIHYRLVAPVLTRGEYGAGVSYVPGDAVYLPATGECYLCVLASVGVSPETDATKWTKQDVPLTLRDYAENAGAAALKREDGQDDTARIFDNLAEDALLREDEKRRQSRGNR